MWPVLLANHGEFGLKGNYAMYHNTGLMNGLWSEVYIEITFTQYGHESAGIVGIIMKPAKVPRWALSLHICSQLCKDLETKKDGYKDNTVKSYKKASHAKMASGDTDRGKLRNK